MDDDYYQLQRQSAAIEQQNAELAEQNRLNAIAAKIQAEQVEIQAAQAKIQWEQLEVTRAAAKAQVIQNEQIIATMETQAAATQGVASVIERGQRAWAEVEMGKLQRLQKKDESEEFIQKQNKLIHLLWRRMEELDEAKKQTPGARFMLWNELQDERAEIAIDAVRDIDFLDRDHEVVKKLRNFINALIGEHPLLCYIAADYKGKINLAAQLQKQPSFRTFAENADAQILGELRRKYPELNIPNGDTYPQKSYNFVQDVTRLKNLCALLGLAGKENDEPAMLDVIMAAFATLAREVLAEEKWKTLPADPLPPAEADFYYYFYRDRFALAPQTPADVLQRVLNPLANYRKITARPIAELRRVKQQKRDEVAAVDNEIARIREAKRQAEERARREAERARREAEERERRRKEAEERARQEAKRRQQELARMRKRMRKTLIDGLFNLLNSGDPEIFPCVESKNEIQLDDTLLAKINVEDGNETIIMNVYGNRLQMLTGNIVHIWSWKDLAGEYDNFSYRAANMFLELFRQAYDVIPSPGFGHIRATLKKPLDAQYMYAVPIAIAVVIMLYVTQFFMGTLFYVLLIASFIAYLLLMPLKDFQKKNLEQRYKQVLDSPTVQSLLENELCIKYTEE